MNDFSETIKSKIPDLECSNAPASEKTIQDIQQQLDCLFGPQLKSYLLDFGYLAHGSNEMYGVNERQLLDSDLVKVSKMLHIDFPITQGMVAVDNHGDGDYILCDSQDMIYEYIPSLKNELIPLKQNLLNYILARMSE